MIRTPATWPGNDISFILRQWRTRTLAIILIVASLLVFPAIVATLFRLVELKEWFWAAFLLGMYFVLLFLTFYRNVNFRLRGYTVLLLGYAAGIFAFIVGGPTGDGRLFLMVMPLYAFVLIGLRSGWVATCASLFVYLAFVLLGNAGVLEGALHDLPARVGNPFASVFWMMTWATLAALLVSIVTLLDRFYRLLLDALTAERQASMELARAYDTTLNVASEMRQKLARDLHDGPTQKIAGLVMQLYYINQLVSRNPEEAKRELENARATAQQTVEEIRTTLFTLRPLVLESKGLSAALQQYGERLRKMEKVLITVEPGDFGNELDVNVAATIFAIIEEAVSNARKHAANAPIHVCVEKPANTLVATVRDEGPGFSVDQVIGSYDRGAHLGLQNMRDRARMVNGELRIDSAPGKGTHITLTVPLTLRAPEASQ
jgi:signal transduction histidine kinase